MGKWCNPDVLDAGLKLTATADIMVATEEQPPSYEYAVANLLCSVNMTSKDFKIVDTPSGGRKLVVSKKSVKKVMETGTAQHVSLLHTQTLRLLYTTTCPAVNITEGGTCEIAEWNVEIGQP